MIPICVITKCVLKGLYCIVLQKLAEIIGLDKQNNLA